MSRVWSAIVLAGIGTYAMRASFLVFAHRLADVPPGIQRILRQIVHLPLLWLVPVRIEVPGQLVALLPDTPDVIRRRHIRSVWLASLVVIEGERDIVLDALGPGVEKQRRVVDAGPIDADLVRHVE